MYRVKRQETSGFTIVELMVALSLTGLLMAGTYKMMSGQVSTYQQQTTKIGVHKNVIAASEFLVDQVRRAGMGFGGCPQSRVLDVNDVTQHYALRAYSNCNLLNTPPANCPDDSGVDSLAVMTLEDEVFTNPATDTHIFTTQLTAPVLVAGDVATLRMGDNFRDNDRLLLWEPGSAQPCSVEEVDGIPTQAAGVFSLNLDASGVRSLPVGGYQAGTVVARLAGGTMPTFFAIDNSTNVPHLVMWQTWNANPSADTGSRQIISDGIEDMQIAVGCQQNPGTPDLEWDTAPNTGTAQAVCTQNVAADDETVEMMRITLVGRSDFENRRGFKAGRPALEDRPAGPADNFRRVRISASVQPINIAGAN